MSTATRFDTMYSAAQWAYRLGLCYGQGDGGAWYVGSVSELVSAGVNAAGVYSPCSPSTYLGG